MASDLAPPWKVGGVPNAVRIAAAAVTRNAGIAARICFRPSNSQTYASRRNGKTNAGAFDRNAATAGIKYHPNFRCSGLAANHNRLATTPNVQ